MVNSSKTSNSKHPKLYIDVLLMVTAGVVALVLHFVLSFGRYKSGLTLSSEWFGFTFWITLLVLPGWFLLILFLIIRGIIFNIRFGINRLLVQILFIIASIGFFISVPIFTKSGYGDFLAGFREYMKTEADIPAIQTWLDTLDLDNLNDCKVDEYGWWIDESSWPDAIRKLNYDNMVDDKSKMDFLKYLVVTNSKNGKTYVRVVYGSTLIGRWSLVVGVGAEKIPLNDHFASEYRLELAPNAFVGWRLKQDN